MGDEARPPRLSVVGQRVPKVDALAKVTGASRYVDDIVLPGMVHARLARSQEPHARLVEVRAERALAVPGVIGLLSAANLSAGVGPLPPYDPACHGFERDEPFQPVPGDFRILDRVVRYTGEPVAAVAAETDAAALEATTWVDVEYERLPAVLDPEAALGDGSPQVHEEAAGNVAARTTRSWGDVDAALAGAAAVVTRRFTTARQKHAQLEVTCCVVEPMPDRGLTVWSPLQAPHRARLTLAHIFGLDANRVRVVNPVIGGAFGKGDALAGEPYAAALALATGRPVKLRFSRPEDFVGTEVRHPSVTMATAAFDGEGRMVALRARTVLDAGAYLSHSPRIAVVVANQLSHLYDVPNVDIEVVVAFTNHPVSGAFRGYGAPQAAFVLEQLVDLGAHDLRLDPLEARRRMLRRPPDRPDGAVDTDVLLECLEVGRRRIGWDELRAAATTGDTARGVGMACVAWKSGLGDKPAAGDQSGAAVHVNQDGTVDLATAACDLGTGVKTTLAQICAEVIGVPLRAVTVSDADTAVTPYESGAHASRSLYRAGQAVQAAALEARGKILDFAGDILEADPSDLELVDGRVGVRGTPSRGISLPDLLHRALFAGHDFHGYGQAPPTGAPTCAAQFAVVEVNRTTGQVRVLRLVAVQEVGRAINPTVVEGQIEGGAHQGIGYALTEQLVVDDGTGTVLNGTFMDYRLMTVADGPLVEAVVLEHPDPTGPFGAKGVGEPGIILPAPAIANAIAHATGGVVVTDLPMTPERVYRALQDATQPAAADPERHLDLV